MNGVGKSYRVYCESDRFWLEIWLGFWLVVLFFCWDFVFLEDFVLFVLICWCVFYDIVVYKDGGELWIKRGNYFE